MNGKEQIFSSAIKLGIIDDWKKTNKNNGMEILFSLYLFKHFSIYTFFINLFTALFTFLGRQDPSIHKSTKL